MPSARAGRFIATLVLMAAVGSGCTFNIAGLPGGSSNGGVSPVTAPDGIDPSNPAIERQTVAIDFAGVTTLRIDVTTGRVALRIEDGATPQLKLTKTVLLKNQSNDQLSKILKGATLTVARSFVDSSRLEISSDLARGINSTDVAFDVQIVLPVSVPTQVIMDNGPAEVKGLKANVEIRTDNGAITLNDIVGNVVAETSKRAIEITNVAGNLRAETSDADIVLKIAPPDGGQVFVETTNGGIDLALSPTTKAAINLDATDGTVTADLTAFGVSNLTTAPDLLRCTLNGGGGQIEARTSGGDIQLVGL